MALLVTQPHANLLGHTSMRCLRFAYQQQQLEDASFQPCFQHTAVTLSRGALRFLMHLACAMQA